MRTPLCRMAGPTRASTPASRSATTSTPGVRLVINREPIEARQSLRMPGDLAEPRMQKVANAARICAGRGARVPCLTCGDEF